MPYTMNDFRKEVALEVMDQLTPEERLRGLTPKQIEVYLRSLGKRKGPRKKKPKPRK